MMTNLNVFSYLVIKRVIIVLENWQWNRKIKFTAEFNLVSRYLSWLGFFYNITLLHSAAIIKRVFSLHSFIVWSSWAWINGAWLFPRTLGAEQSRALTGDSLYGHCWWYLSNSRHSLRWGGNAGGSSEFTRADLSKCNKLSCSTVLTRAEHSHVSQNNTLISFRPARSAWSSFRKQDNDWRQEI